VGPATDHRRNQCQTQNALVRPHREDSSQQTQRVKIIARRQQLLVTLPPQLKGCLHARQRKWATRSLRLLLPPSKGQRSHSSYNLLIFQSLNLSTHPRWSRYCLRKIARGIYSVSLPARRRMKR
jgi:hypothetical protein